MEDNKGQILLYQTADGESRIEVRLEGETVWLSLDQMAELFQRNKSTISRHIKNVFEEGSWTRMWWLQNLQLPLSMVPSRGRRRATWLISTTST